MHAPWMLKNFHLYELHTHLQWDEKLKCIGFAHTLGKHLPSNFLRELLCATFHVKLGYFSKCMPPGCLKFVIFMSHTHLQWDARLKCVGFVFFCC
jgi:hypothetical protein